MRVRVPVLYCGSALLEQPAGKNVISNNMFNLHMTSLKRMLFADNAK